MHMELQTWLLFALACTCVALTPGPNSLLILTNSVHFGARKTMYTVMGGVMTFLLLMAISLFGLNAILAVYPHFLAHLKLIGGLYLLWLGIQQWRTPPLLMNGGQDVSRVESDGALFFQGVFAAGSNPKVLIFFSAFLSPFIRLDSNLVTQFLLMALTFGMAEFMVECSINLGAKRCRSAIYRMGRIFNGGCALMFIAIGMAILFG